MGTLISKEALEERRMDLEFCIKMRKGTGADNSWYERELEVVKNDIANRIWEDK